MLYTAIREPYSGNCFIMVKCGEIQGGGCLKLQPVFEIAPPGINIMIPHTPVFEGNRHSYCFHIHVSLSTIDTGVLPTHPFESTQHTMVIDGNTHSALALHACCTVISTGVSRHVLSIYQGKN